MIVDLEELNKVAGRERLPVLHLFVFDPFWYRNTTRLCGFPKTGSIRARFQVEAVADLAENLGYGCDLGAAPSSGLGLGNGVSGATLRELPPLKKFQTKIHSAYWIRNDQISLPNTLQKQNRRCAAVHRSGTNLKTDSTKPYT